MHWEWVGMGFISYLHVFTYPKSRAAKSCEAFPYKHTQFYEGKVSNRIGSSVSK